MDRDNLIELLSRVRDGEVNVDDALSCLKTEPFEKISHSMVDRHRAIRAGHPEVIYCGGKTSRQICDILKTLAAENSNIIATRLSPEKAREVMAEFPSMDMDYSEEARIAVINRDNSHKRPGLVVVISAGTSDIPVAEEAAITAEAMGNNVERIYDAGVAGIHRLFAHVEIIDKASVIIAVAGMEGALASVVAGLNDKPVIAVPTSVGYGANFGGLAPLLAMLNSCAGGVSVVNIDNGFGAGYIAGLINRQIENHAPSIEKEIPHK